MVKTTVKDPYKQVPKGEVANGDIEAHADGIPRGQWRSGLDGCDDDCTLFVFGCCLRPILVGQIMQRMNLNVFGCPIKDGSRSCSFLFYLMFSLVGALLVSGNINAFTVPWAIFLVVVITIARFQMRKRYGIGPSCCFGDDPVDDCCVSCFCAPCGTIQMASHIYGRNYYPFSTDGVYDSVEPAAPVANTIEVV